MFRSILFLLILLVVPSTHGEELFWIDTDRVLSVALSAAYEANPDFAPGDLLDHNEESMFTVYCSPARLPSTASKEYEFKQCTAHVEFQIAKATQTTITRQGDRCIERTEGKSVYVTVFADGSVRAGKHSQGSHTSSSNSSKITECPDTDNTE